MSRGIGQLQRQVLAALETAGEPQTATQLALAFWPNGWERSSEVSLRRAMHGLVRRRLAWVQDAHKHRHMQLLIGLPHHECDCEAWSKFAVGIGLNPTSKSKRWQECTKCRESMAADPRNAYLLNQPVRFAKYCLVGCVAHQATHTTGEAP